MYTFLLFLRIMFIAILIWGSMIHWHWKAALISFLAVDNPTIPFKSTGELIHSPYQITLLKDSSYQTLFEKTDTEPLKTVWKTKFLHKEKSLLTTSEEMVSLVLTGNYAMYEASTTLQTFQAFQDCLITDVGFHVERLDFAFALQKKSPYKKLLNYMLRRMIETGTLHRFLYRDTYFINCTFSLFTGSM